MITPNPLPPTCITGVVPTSGPLEGRFPDTNCSCGIDHLRLTGDHQTYGQAKYTWDQIWGPTELEGRSTSSWYSDSYVHPVSLSRLHTGHRTTEGGWMIEMTGTGCSEFSNHRSILDAFTSLIHHPLIKPTRIDLAVDLYGPCETYIEDMAQSGPHIQPTVQVDPIRKTQANQVINHGLQLGTRSSARYLRIYDKGLQSDTAPQGQHIRWEAEFKKDAANSVLKFLANNPLDSTLRSLARGAIGHITGPGAKWADLICTAPIRPALHHRGESLAGYVAHLQNTLATICYASQLSGLDPHDILDKLQVLDLTRDYPKKSTRKKRALEIIQHCASFSDTL